jgi:hypothetical protein
MPAVRAKLSRALFLCASLLVLVISPPQAQGLDLPEAPELRVGIASFESARRRAETFRSWLEERGFSRVDLLSVGEVQDGGLDGVDLLIVPRAAEVPLELWRHLPEYHARGGHLLFEGVPLTTGRWGSSKFEPGIGPDLHLFYEREHLPGLPENGKRSTLRAHGDLESTVAFEPRTLQGRGGGRRSIQKWVRRYKSNSTGQIEFRDDIESDRPR